ncbi:TadE-like protein [Mariprofundus ferrinatatus]|uniref:TadE-like protein n=1 Tax=Mariprofundus ferrinatatus TaxID=1921087 RepID=A0A2K8L3E1_9PROT|nr:TadE/TadG family type IV pilus assembly protein [Mariprofundus ferrinatatus]ATX81773.1 TadE-like protein [Mariprofundus ferrinatatus]
MLTFNSTNDRWQTRCRGAVMVEFAIITPLLILLVFGITELGRALYQENILTQAVQTGARYMARVPDILDVDNNCAQQAGWSAAETAAKNIIVYGTVETGTTPLLPNLATANVTITSAVSTDAGVTISACIISIHAEADFAGIFGPEYSIPPIPFIGSTGTGGLSAITLNAETQERYTGE